MRQTVRLSPTSWVWDFWLRRRRRAATTCSSSTPRARCTTRTPRHYRASIGHAVSTDLVELDAASPTPSCAATLRLSTTWPPGPARWCGTRTARGSCSTPAPRSRPDGQNVQRIGLRHLVGPRRPGPSRGRTRCSKRDAALVREARPRRSGTTRRSATRGCSPTRTATAGTCSSPPARRTGPVDGRGVVGHAWSPDLRTLGAARATDRAERAGGFGQLEVMQVEVVDGRPGADLLVPGRARRPTRGATGGRRHVGGARRRACSARSTSTPPTR